MSDSPETWGFRENLLNPKNIGTTWNDPSAVRAPTKAGKTSAEAPREGLWLVVKCVVTPDLTINIYEPLTRLIWVNQLF
jgi:hypothetical protein